MRPDVHPNAVLTRRSYDLIGKGEHRGKDAIIRLGTLVLEETGGTFQTASLSVQANDAYSVALHRWTAERRGERVEMDNFQVYGFERGLVVERWEHVADQRAHDAFWRR